MHNIRFLSCAFLISLPLSATEPFEKIRQPPRQLLCSSCDCTYSSQPQYVPVPPVKKVRAQPSIYCPELNCWSLKECLLHHPRYIFFTYILNKSKRQKAVKKVESVLPMMPQEVGDLIGGYAQEEPTQYKIKNYQEVSFLAGVVDNKVPGGFINKNGEIVMDPTDTKVELQSTGFLDRHPKKFSLVLTPIELGFFKHALKSRSRSMSVAWQYTADKDIVLLMRHQGWNAMETKDRLLLKQTSAENKALKAAGLLPNKKRKH